MHSLTHTSFTPVPCSHATDLAVCSDVIDIMDSERAEVVNGRSKPSVQVVVGTVRSDGGVQTTRYTADDNGDMHVTTDTYTNNHGQQQLEEQQEEEEGDNLDEAASIAGEPWGH